MRYPKYLGFNSRLGNNYFLALNFEVSDVTEYHRWKSKRKSIWGWIMSPKNVLGSNALWSSN